MTVRIGFVGGEGSTELCEAVRALLPAGAVLETFAGVDAVRQAVCGDLLLMITPLAQDAERQALRGLMELRIGNDRCPVPVPVLVLAPRDDCAALVEAFEMGAADVASLPLEPQEFRARVTALMRRRQQELVRAAETRAAWRMAMVDPVTGLHNRHQLDLSLPAAIDAARESGRPLALLMIDLDALKPFNDRWGHAAGDRVLRTVAEALQSGVRATDTIARYGGDEIAVVMPETDASTARAVAARLVRLVAQTRIGRVADGLMGITVSIGMATLNDDDIDKDALLMRADSALYDAKRNGRNRVAEAA